MQAMRDARRAMTDVLLFGRRLLQCCSSPQPNVSWELASLCWLRVHWWLAGVVTLPQQLL